VQETVRPEEESRAWRYSRRGELLPAHCLDCGATMGGPFCATCGQRNEPEHRSLWQLVKDAVGPAVLLEGKLWRTLWTLLRHPGALSVAYTEGKRSRYIRPLRLYFWVSVLLFALLSFAHPRIVVVKMDQGEQIRLPLLPGLRQRLQTKLEQLKTPPGTSQDVGSRELTPSEQRLHEEFIGRLPKAIFLMLPFFAGLLRLLWWKRPYVEHLIFALHAHTVVFLGLMLGLTRLAPLAILGLLAPAAWFVVALRRFYGSPWWAIGLKTVALGVLYTLVLSAGMVLTALIALLAT